MQYSKRMVGEWNNHCWKLKFVNYPTSRYGIGIRTSDQTLLGIDIEKSLVAFKVSYSLFGLSLLKINVFQYSRWDSKTEICPVIDMTLSLASLPTWMAPYTTAPNGCLQWIYVTMKIKDSRSNYLAFTAEIISQLSPLQCTNLSYVSL